MENSSTSLYVNSCNIYLCFLDALVSGPSLQIDIAGFSLCKKFKYAKFIETEWFLGVSNGRNEKCQSKGKNLHLE